MDTSIQSQSPLAISRPSLPLGDARWLTSLGTHISRYSLVLILFWIGIQKFTVAETEGIKPIIMHSPLMSWMYSFLSIGAASSVIGVD